MFRISCFLQETRRTATAYLYFNLEKIFQPGVLSPVHAAHLPALRVISAIFCNFADFCNFTGEVFFYPMISYETCDRCWWPVPYAIRHQ